MLGNGATAPFHEAVASSDIPVNESMFIKGLATLESLRTLGGEGLREFLDQNLGQFPDRVASEIRALAEEFYENDKQ